MAELGNFKKHNKLRKPASLDGFISTQSFKKRSDFEFEKDGTKSNQEQTIKLDNFSRPDGYSPTVPVVGGSEIQGPLLSDKPRTRKDANSPLKDKRQKRRFIRRPKSWPKFFKKAALVLGMLVVIIGGFLGYKLYITQRHIFKGGGRAPALDQNVNINALNGEGDGRVNILLLGIGGPGHDGPDLTDTILLASIDPVNNEIGLLSVPRDLWVQIPGHGTQKINAAYPDGKYASSAKDESGKDKDGLSLIDKTLTNTIGVPIHYNVLVDFTAFKDSVNAVGGVTFNVPETLYDPTIAWENHNNPYIALKGNQTFDGAKALLYARSRETSSDFARAERQRQLLVALKDKILSLGTFSNPFKVSQLLDSLGNNVYTDFESSKIPRLYQIGSQIPSSSIKSLDFVTPPNQLVTTGNIGGLSVVRPVAGLFDYSAIQSYVRNVLKDGFIKKENANITILNGTNLAGLATKQADVLKSYGYNVGTVGDAPSHNYQKTVLVAFKDGSKKYTQHYLENRLGVTATTKLPDNSISPGSADFVIILGTDAINRN